MVEDYPRWERRDDEIEPLAGKREKVGPLPRFGGTATRSGLHGSSAAARRRLRVRGIVAHTLVVESRQRDTVVETLLQR